MKCNTIKKNVFVHLGNIVMKYNVFIKYIIFHKNEFRKNLSIFRTLLKFNSIKKKSYLVNKIVKS